MKNNCQWTTSSSLINSFKCPGLGPLTLPQKIASTFNCSLILRASYLPGGSNWTSQNGVALLKRLNSQSNHWIRATSLNEKYPKTFPLLFLLFWENNGIKLSSKFELYPCRLIFIKPLAFISKIDPEFWNFK